eukprot:13930907-Alexandrium_andersonii.AAC.1
MSASLVGSEMCIRDSPCAARGGCGPSPGATRGSGGRTGNGPACGSSAVSYTHLTLPTICSV